MFQIILPGMMSVTPARFDNPVDPAAPHRRQIMELLRAERQARRRALWARLRVLAARLVRRPALRSVESGC